MRCVSNNNKRPLLEAGFAAEYRSPVSQLSGSLATFSRDKKAGKERREWEHAGDKGVEAEWAAGKRAAASASRDLSPRQKIHFVHMTPPRG